MKIIKDEYSLGTQSANFCNIIESDSGIKIKIDIKSDSYDFQSYARVSVFNPADLKWNILSNIPFSNMKTPPKLYYGLNNQNPNILASYFLQDKNQLINEAEQILGDKFSLIPTEKKTQSKKNKP